MHIRCDVGVGVQREGRIGVTQNTGDVYKRQHMKIFAIRDESAQEQKDLAYLLYYEQEKRFYIELPENRCV